ncbi:GNAT family N-acetyltransferase [Crossiella sp. SN42]|nr:GNAT family N-acetyltransferase [Crossiella sp. SN42]MCO1578612.1 GNAT family N-acetyltransferase [Crossiella sp. SN42]
MTAAVLRTRRLVLRPLELADAPRLAEVFADPDASRWLGRDLSQPGAVREWALERTAADYPEGMGYWTFWLDETVIGYGHLRPSHELPAPLVETGWSIGSAHWGSGLAGRRRGRCWSSGSGSWGCPRCGRWCGRRTSRACGWPGGWASSRSPPGGTTGPSTG